MKKFQFLPPRPAEDDRYVEGNCPGLFSVDVCNGCVRISFWTEVYQTPMTIPQLCEGAKTPEEVDEKIWELLANERAKRKQQHPSGREDACYFHSMKPRLRYVEETWKQIEAELHKNSEN